MDDPSLTLPSIIYHNCTLTRKTVQLFSFFLMKKCFSVSLRDCGSNLCCPLGKPVGASLQERTVWLGGGGGAGLQLARPCRCTALPSCKTVHHPRPGTELCKCRGLGSTKENTPSGRRSVTEVFWICPLHPLGSSQARLLQS